MSALDAYWNDCLVGFLRQKDTGEMSFQYADQWLQGRNPMPISQSLPLRTESFSERLCMPFFSGLLPDSQATRKRLGDIFEVSSDNDFELLANLGRDCAGAIVFSRHNAPLSDRAPWLELLSDKRLAQLIDDLPRRPLFAEEDEVMLSLAGVHDKAALFIDDDGNIHLPHQGYPSSHILKIDIDGLPDSIRTEHFCLSVAREMKIRAPRSKIRVVDGKPFMLVGRYDRVVAQHVGGARLRRLHQEDFCQALGVLPRLKYEKEGGPNLQQMFDLLRRVATVPAKDIQQLASYVIFNFLIGNPDSHAKNYSLVYRESADGSVTTSLSPLYDINNAAAFRSYFKEQRPRIAQAIGGERNPTKLTLDHWQKFAKDAGISWPGVRKLLMSMAADMPAAVRAQREAMRGTEADSEVLDLVVDDVIARCDWVVSWMKN